MHSQPLTREDVEKVIAGWRQYRVPRVLFVSPSFAVWLHRYKTARVVKEWPGAVRYVAADGHTWIEKRWRTADVDCGNSHRTKRRLGVPVDEVMEWEYPG